MGKKKKNQKKKQKSIMLLSDIDHSIAGKHDSLVEEIQEIQLRLNIADAKAMEKQRKKMIRADMGVIPYYVSKDKVKAREKILKDMERTNFFGRIEETFKNLVPCIVLIARLVAALIVAILSVEPIKQIISPALLKRMNSIYNVAMAIH